MKQQAQLNEKKKSRGRRHNNKVINQFCINAVIMGGGKFLLTANSAGALPSRRIVDKPMKICDLSISEGEVNVKLLLQILTQQKLPFRVSLAEDATSVVSIREYDISSNRIFGFSLPLCSNSNQQAFFVHNYMSANFYLYGQVSQTIDVR